MILGNQYTKNVLRDEIVLCDWDSVIQEVDFYWMEKVLSENYIHTFKNYLDFDKLIDKETGDVDISLIKKRNTYYLTEYMRKEGVDPNPELEQLFISLYIDDKDFYNYCPFLTMADSLKVLLANNIVKEVHFVSSAPLNYDTDDRKVIQMNKMFPKMNVDMNIIPGNMKKSEYINTYFPNYTVFIDDREDVMLDVMFNTNNNNKSYIFPLYEYNKNLLDEKVLNKIALVDSKLSMYESEPRFILD